MRTDFADSIKKGFIVNARYTVESVINRDILGFTYLVRDVNTGESFTLKEYFPEGIAERGDDLSVSVVSMDKVQLFEGGKNDFLNEARALNASLNENIVNVKTCFEFNNTAYYVNECFDSISLKDYINNSGGKISMSKARDIIYPVMNALAVLNNKGVHHLNISPDCIYITSNGVVKLGDFSTALVNYAVNSRRIDSVINYGFSSKELYSRNSNKGAYSDVYSLAAVIYTALTGIILPESIDRFDGEVINYPSSYGCDITSSEEAALKKALSVNAGDRYTDINSFRNALTSKAQPDFQSQSYQPAPQQTYNSALAPKKKSKFPKWIIPVAAAVVVTLIIGVAACAMLLSKPDPAKDFKYNLNSSGVTINKYIGKEDTAVIPSEIEGKPVEVIGANAFNGSPLEEIAIPSTVKTIEKGAFSNTVVTKINIPESVTEINEYAFKSSSIESITIPGSVKEISKYIFNECDKLTSVTLSDGVSKVGEYAFSGCKSLEDVKLPESLDTISSGAFSGCIGLKKISIPNHVSSIKSSAFSGCGELASLEAYGNSVSSKKGTFDAYVFSNCYKLKSITVPKSIKSLSKFFISSNKTIETVNMQEGLKQIGQNAFMFCNKLKKADIPHSVTSIGNSAFWGCESLKSYSIPLGVKVIKKYTFNQCKSFKEIYIPSTVKKVETGAFSNCTSVKKILIGYKIKNIGKYAFSGCNKIKSLVVPSRMKTIPRAAFFGMKGIKHLTIPKSIKKIKSSAFLSCKKLKTVYVAKKCKVNKYAFPYGVKVKRLK